MIYNKLFAANILSITQAKLADSAVQMVVAWAWALLQACPRSTSPLKLTPRAQAKSSR